MVRAVHKLRRLDVLLPVANWAVSQKIFETYWDRFRCQYPQHEIFEQLSATELRACVPIKLHGDEAMRAGDPQLHFTISLWKPVRGVHCKGFEAEAKRKAQ